jgi:hypothetical protein
MTYFNFIVSVNDEKEYTYERDIVNQIETLDDLKMMAIDEYTEGDEDAANLIDERDISVRVKANGEFYSYLAERFNEGTADDIIKILDELITDNYDEYQVIAYFDCFWITDFDLQKVYDKMFGEGYYKCNADAAAYYIDNFLDNDIPDYIKNVIDYDAAYTYFGLCYELVESRGYYFWR